MFPNKTLLYDTVVFYLQELINRFQPPDKACYSKPSIAVSRLRHWANRQYISHVFRHSKSHYRGVN